MARRDEPTKGTHSLSGEVAVASFHLQELPQGSGDEGSQFAKAGTQRMWGERHGEIRVNILFDNHDTSWSTILCKIALFARNVS
jgi:hypothetical protein